MAFISSLYVSNLSFNYLMSISSSSIDATSETILSSIELSRSISYLARDLGGMLFYLSGYVQYF